MDLRRVNSYDADPYAVFGMMTDEEFLTRRAVETKALRHKVSVSAAADGTVRARTRRSLPVDVLPDIIRRLVGDSIDVDELVTWNLPEPDGTRTATVSAEVARVPVRADGTMRLVVDGPARTRQVVELEIKASVPLLGGKLEEAAAPAVLAALEVEERLGAKWLQPHP